MKKVKVICTNGKGCYLTTDKEYELLKPIDKYNTVRVKNDLNIIIDYHLSRFKIKLKNQKNAKLNFKESTDG